jgi:hypothetical protein
MPSSSSARVLASCRLFQLALATSLTVSALLYFLWSWRWPLVGDASLMHYIAFLIERGWAPYRDLGDMNMPGSFLIEMAAMHLFGAGALAWRLFDFALLAIASASFFSITGPIRVLYVREATVEILPALFAASLFILIHGRDGIAQGGQRDLTMAVCLVAATAFLIQAVRKKSPLSAAAFGLLSGIAVTIKPTACLLTFIQLALAIYVLARKPQSKHLRFWPQLTAAAAAAYLIAPAAVLTFLIRHHAIPAFLAGLRTTVPYYASLGHRPLGYVIQHSLSPLLPLVIIWLAILALDRPLLRATLNWSQDPDSQDQDWQRTLLLAGVLFGFINCVLQARALPYYRYPLLAFLLPLMALDFTRAATNPGAPSMTVSSSWVGSSHLARYLAIAALIVGGLFLAPQSALLIHRYRWDQTDLITSLQQNLNTLGGATLSGHIQCIDTNSGCGNVLYLMRLEPSTGMLSDFFLFGPGTEGAQAPVVRRTREQFSAAILANPPRVIVVTSRLYLADPGTYDNFTKLDRWPAFKSFLAEHYTLQTQWTPTRTERWWSREEKPAAYRIYVLR